MPPSSGSALVLEAVKVFKHLVSNLRARLPQEAALAKQAIPVRVAQPLHPLAALRQSQSQQRNFTTAASRVTSVIGKPVHAARSSAGQAVRSTIARGNFAPFSSPLRPNLTGGAIPRTSGGYSLGGKGVRHFSSTPAAQAHVVQNVSAAIRAFCINGYKAQYDGKDARTGAKKWKAISTTQEKTLMSIRQDKVWTKGTNLEFRIAPMITAIPALEQAETDLESEDVLNGLASDFSRSLSCLAAVHADLKKLATLGSLPISYPNPYTLSLRFAGCDGATVEALCNELGVQRGIVREDPEWDEHEGDKEVEMALLFPWAPSGAPSEIANEDLFGPPPPKQISRKLDWQDMISESSTSSMHRPSRNDYPLVLDPIEASFTDPWRSASYSESYDALRDSDIESNEECMAGLDLARMNTVRPAVTSAYEGMEGILRFIEQCESAAQ